MQQKADALVAHALPGRIRLRIPEKKGDGGYFEALLAAIGACQGLAKLVINPATASVLIHYQADCTDGLNGFLEKNSFFRVVEAESPPPPAVTGTESKQGGAAGKGQVAVVPMETSRLVGLGLICWSCYRLFQDGFKSPPWHAALWYGYTLYRGGQRQGEEKSGQAAGEERVRQSR